MCGIAGILGLPMHTAKVIAPRMLEAMRHRGPDDSGMQILPDPRGEAPPAVLLHTRLAILDLSPAGHQPMGDNPPLAGWERNWIVYNGEVCNFRELQRELACSGWPFRTRCDTEVILHSYRLWGEGCVERFRGMFAWCLMDSEQGTAWFCRDRLGIKPLYLFRPASGGLLFASELRTLLAAGPDILPPIVNAAALESFLAQGAVFGLQSIVEGVELLAPGQSLVTDWSGRPRKTWKYWEISFTSAIAGPTSPPSRVDRRRAVAHLADELREAVKLRLIADVPLGLFLSGGIDSTAIAALATEQLGTRVQSISIGFDQPEFDETEAARAVANELGTNHRSIRLTGEEVLDDLPDVLAAMDQPTVDGFNTYFVARAASRAGLKVALSGLGGDELFGGYASFRDVPRALRWRQRLRWICSANKGLAALLDWSGGRRGAKAAVMLDRPASPVLMYLLRRELFLRKGRRALHPLPANSDPHSGLPREIVDDLQARASGLDLINQMSLFEMGAYLRHMLLRDADVFSMRNALEVRVPLLDHKVVELAARSPGKYKRPGPRPKPLLIDAVGPRMPTWVWSRPKRGFTFPWDAWLRGPMRQRAVRAIDNRELWASLGLNWQGARRLWERFLAKDSRVGGLQVLALLTLEDFAARHGLRRAA
jgi:asparagine synthase (glutamine-hydrolysing)